MDPGLVANTDKGRWMRAPLSAPLSVTIGDRVEVEGTTAWLLRGEHYVDSREIGESVEYEPPALVAPHELTEVIFFRRDPMPAAAVTLTNVTINQTSGVIRADFSDGSQLEHSDFAALVSAVDEYDTQTDHAKNLLLLALVRRSPDGSNLDALNGSSCTIDGQAANPVQFSLNE